MPHRRRLELTMKSVDQSSTRWGVGNCLQACLASILEVPLEATPNFLVQESDWLDALAKWLDVQFAMSVVLLKFGDTPSFTQPRGYCVASGPTRRYPKHSVVWLEGRIVHDPHPARPGLNRIDDLLVFTVPNPIVLIRNGNGRSQPILDRI